MKKVIVGVQMILMAMSANAQNVGIGTPTPNANAILDISSNNKGLLLPRLADTNAITGTKPAGLLIYSNADKQVYFYNGNNWQKSAAQSATDLWYVKNDSVIYTNSRYVGINSDINQSPLQATLQVNGSIMAQQNMTQSKGAATATAIMNNTTSTQVIGVDDSVLRVIDPGGSNNNYTNNMQGNISITLGAELGFQVSFNPADFGLGTGDTLWISSTNSLENTRNNYLYRFTNSNIAPSDLLISRIGRYIYFRSNADGNNNKGFDITFRRIYDTVANYPPVGSVGNAFYFNPSNGALRSGVTLGGTIGIWSTAMGSFTIASGSSSTAMGSYTKASGGASIAMGLGTIASETGSAAMGSGTTALGYASVAMGYSTTAANYTAVAMGKSTIASGYSTTAMGENTLSKAYASLCIGRNNDEIASSSTSTWVDTDPLLILGNGASDAARSNAMVVYKDGNTDINGYTQLGKASEGAPAIKTKKIIGYNTPTSTNPNTFTYVPHGLTASKILSISVLINASGNYEIMPQSTQAGYTYSVNTDPTGGGQANVAVGVKSAAESSSVMGRPIKIFITYEE